MGGACTGLHGMAEGGCAGVLSGVRAAMACGSRRRHGSLDCWWLMCEGVRQGRCYTLLHECIVDGWVSRLISVKIADVADYDYSWRSR